MTRSRPLLIAALAVLAAATGWLLLGGESSSAPPGLDDPSMPLTTNPLEGEAEVATADGPDDVLDEFEALEGGERVADDVEPTDGRKLRVVDGRNNQPIGEAEVFAMDADLMRRTPRPDSITHWNEHLVAVAQPVRTDAEGRVVLPAFRRALLIAARTESMFGVLRLGRNAPEESTLALRPDQSLVVRVLKSDDRPATDTRVLLSTTDGRDLDRVAAVKTDGDGYAEFQHVWLHRRPAYPTQIRVVELTELMQAALNENQSLRFEFKEERVRRNGREVIQSRRVRRTKPLTPAEQARVKTTQAQFDKVRNQINALRPAMQQERQQGRRNPESLPAADFVIRADVPERSPPVVALRGGVVPERPVVLRLGATGALTVSLRRPDGTPLASPCRIKLGMSGLLPPRPGVHPRATQSVRNVGVFTAEKKLGEESVHFPLVGLGLRFTCAVRFADRDFNFTSQPQSGPVIPGEDRLIEVRVPDWFTVLTGRLADAGGNPIANRQAQLMVTSPRGRVEGERLTTEPDGGFELPLRLQTADRSHALEIGVAQGGDDSASTLGALINLPKLEPGKRHDLGTIPLGVLPTLAHGTVRDDRGEPVAGARITLQVYRPEGGRNRNGFPNGRGPRGRNGLPAAPNNRNGRNRNGQSARVPAWLDEAYMRTETDEAGRYRLRGLPRPERLRLRAGARDHVTNTSAPLTVGDQVDFTLSRTGTLMVNGRLPGWVPRPALRLVVRQGERQVRSIELRRRGSRFNTRLRGLLPGPYDVALELRGVPRPLIDARAVRIGPGDPTRDPRLTNVDLRSSIHRYVVRAIDGEGKPIRSNSPLLAQLPDSNGALKFTGFPWRGGRVEFITAQSSVSIALLASGFLPVRTNVSPGEHTLQMQRLQPIRVDVTGLRALVGPERRVRISLVYDGHTGLPMEDLTSLDQRRGQNRRFARAALGKSSGAWLGKNDRVQMRLMLEGRYDVVARIYPEGGRGGPISTSLGTVMARLTGPEPVVVRAPANAGQVQGVLAELARRAQTGR